MRLMPRYKIEYELGASRQIEKLTKRQRVTLLDAIHRNLTWEPLVQTRNREPLDDSEVGGSELRVGDLRAYYDVSEEEQIVWILAGQDGDLSGTAPIQPFARLFERPEQACASMAVFPATNYVVNWVYLRRKTYHHPRV